MVLKQQSSNLAGIFTGTVWIWPFKNCLKRERGQCRMTPRFLHVKMLRGQPKRTSAPRGVSQNVDKSSQRARGLQCKRASAFTQHVGQEGNVTTPSYTLYIVQWINTNIRRPLQLATVCWVCCCSTLPSFSSCRSPGSWHWWQWQTDMTPKICRQRPITLHTQH